MARRRYHPPGLPLKAPVTGPQGRKGDCPSAPMRGDSAEGTTENSRRRPLPPPALWLLAAHEVQKAVRSDDQKGAVKVRQLALAALGGVEAGAPCPDPQLYAQFEAATRLWASRIEFHARDRLYGPVLSYAAALEGLVRKPAQPVLPGLIRGLPADDR